MRKTDFDSKLLIYKSRRFLLTIAVIFMTALFTWILLKNDKNGYHWTALAIIFTALGSLFLFFPMTERWEYKPWQGKPRRVEQQQR